MQLRLCSLYLCKSFARYSTSNLVSPPNTISRIALKPSNLCHHSHRKFSRKHATNSLYQFSNHSNSDTLTTAHPNTCMKVKCYSLLVHVSDQLGKTKLTV